MGKQAGKSIRELLQIGCTYVELPFATDEEGSGVGSEVEEQALEIREERWCFVHLYLSIFNWQ